MFYWIGDQPISNVPGGAYIDYLYFSIETLSTAGYGDMHPQTHYGHFIATVELFTGIFSMSLMTGLIFARFSRPNARLLFADNPVISNHEGKPTLMVRLANERHNIISNATARLWLFKNIVSMEGQSFRRFYELPLVRNENPALALSWTLFHVIDEQSPLYGLDADDLEAANVSLVVVVSGYDVVAAQTVHARKSYDHPDIRFGHRYADILGTSEDGRLRIDYGRFHETCDGIDFRIRAHANISCETPRERAKQIEDVPELAAVKTQRPIASEDEHRVLQFRPRTSAHRAGPGRRELHARAAARRQLDSASRTTCRATSAPATSRTISAIACWPMSRPSPSPWR